MTAAGDGLPGIGGEGSEGSEGSRIEPAKSSHRAGFMLRSGALRRLARSAQV